MPDPFLAAHRIIPRFYLISGPSPISMRDQMLRGAIIVDRLRKPGGELSKGGSLLIIGAGAGGVTAAYEAVMNGIPTTLLEKNAGPFSLQNGIASRWLHPTQYDWPLDHWEKHSFPWDDHRRLVLPYDTGANGNSGNELYVAWKKAHDDKLIPMCGDDVHYGATLGNIVPATGSLEVSWKKNETEFTKSVAVILWAAGFGAEDIELETTAPLMPYYGPGFWSNDGLAGPRAGVPIGVRPKILISGGGDGALQDYLRIISGKELAGTLYRALNIPNDVIYKIQSAEDRAHRAGPWGKHDPYAKELQRKHLEVIATHRGSQGIIDRQGIAQYPYRWRE